jgi:hypothetical protein
VFRHCDQVGFDDIDIVAWRRVYRHVSPAFGRALLAHIDPLGYVCR